MQPVRNSKGKCPENPMLSSPSCHSSTREASPHPHPILCEPGEGALDSEIKPEPNVPIPPRKYYDHWIQNTPLTNAQQRSGVQGMELPFISNNLFPYAGSCPVQHPAYALSETQVAADTSSRWGCVPYHGGDQCPRVAHEHYMNTTNDEFRQGSRAENESPRQSYFVPSQPQQPAASMMNNGGSNSRYTSGSALFRAESEKMSKFRFSNSITGRENVSALNYGRLPNGRIIELYPAMVRTIQACEYCRSRKAKVREKKNDQFSHLSSLIVLWRPSMRAMCEEESPL